MDVPLSSTAEQIGKSDEGQKKYLVANLYEDFLNLDILTVTDLSQIYEQAEDVLPTSFTWAAVIIHIERHDFGIHYGYVIGYEVRYHRVEGGWVRGNLLPDRITWRAIDGTTFSPVSDGGAQYIT